MCGRKLEFLLLSESYELYLVFVLPDVNGLNNYVVNHFILIVFVIYAMLSLSSSQCKHFHCDYYRLSVVALQVR